MIVSILYDWKVKVKSLSLVWLFVTPWTVAYQAGSSVHGILPARVLEWVAISFARGSSWPRDRTQVSCLAGRRFNLWATREALGRAYTWDFSLCTASLIWSVHSHERYDPWFFRSTQGSLWLSCLPLHICSFPITRLAHSVTVILSH